MSPTNCIDLSALPDDSTTQTDVCIIGAGAAGLYLSTELSRNNIKSVVIEAGPPSASSASEIGFDPIFGDETYPGATVGRFFGLGGSTSRWGGALVPHTIYDLRDGLPHEQTWKTIVALVARHSSSVLNRFGYQGDPDFAGYAVAELPMTSGALAQVGVDVQSNLMMPFRRKNLLSLLQEANLAAAPRVYFNAVAKDWQFQQLGGSEHRITQVVAVSRNGKRIAIIARRFVIAAGAIESARILLEVNQLAGGRLCRPAAVPGCFLADHLSLPIADVVPEDTARACQLFAPRFQQAWLRNFRFLTKPKNAIAPRAFAHFIFEQDSKAFLVAKEILNAIQEQRNPLLSMKDVIQAVGGLSLLAYNRFFLSQLYVPQGTSIRMQLDIEQDPIEKNRVSLSCDLDEYGRRRAKVDWSVSDLDCFAMEEAAAHFLSRWPSGEAGLPRLKPRTVSSDIAKPYDAYHPVGTCRMGDGDNAVVDLKLKVTGAKNLWILSTAVLPSAGTANPTFTLLCLAQGLVEELVAAT